MLIIMTRLNSVKNTNFGLCNKISFLMHSIKYGVCCHLGQTRVIHTTHTNNGTFSLYLKTFAVGVLKFYQVHNKYMWVNISSRYVPNIPHVNKLS